MSSIDLICRPAAASAWIADSRPDPGPCTRTSKRLTPSPSASRPTFSAAMVAANGVDFFDPLKPAVPALAQTTALPALSVIVMIVLLKVAFIWAMPSASTTFFGFANFLFPRYGCGKTGLLFPLGPHQVIRMHCMRRMSKAIYFLGAFFFPVIALREPLWVRALVFVLWPRTGSPRRWRSPR